MDDPRLRRQLDVEEAKVRGIFGEVLVRDPEAVIPWTGRQMVVAKLVPHMRNEFAIHRWDIAGDDQQSAELLGQHELTEHAVTVLGEILVARGTKHDPGGGEDFHARLRAAGTPDVRLVVDSGQARLELAGDNADEPDVELDPAARALVIWGRRPAERGRFRAIWLRRRSPDFRHCSQDIDLLIRR